MKGILSVENIVHGFRAYSTFSGLKSSLTKCEVTGISVLNGNKAASKLKLIPLHLTLKSFGKFCKFHCNFLFKRNLINPIQNEPFWSCSLTGGGGRKRPPP